MEYSEKADSRLWALIIIAAAIVPSMVAIELAVPGYQPRFGVQAGSSGGTPSGGGGGPIHGVNVVMPNGVQFNHLLNFQPATITLIIGKNNTVTWTNKDTADHTVTFSSGPAGVNLATISSDLGSDQTFTVTFSAPGTYLYHCTFHPGWMRGVIVVKSA